MIMFRPCVLTGLNGVQSKLSPVCLISRIARVYLNDLVPIFCGFNSTSEHVMHVWNVRDNADSA